jgi:hypothetical protein
MPEELPVVESIKKIETKQRKQLGKAETPAKKKSEQPDILNAFSCFRAYVSRPVVIRHRACWTNVS